MVLTVDQAAIYSAVVEQTVKQEFTGTLKVNSDNTYTSNFGGVTETGTWSLNSDGTKLTVTPANDTPTTFDVVELTSSKLHLHIQEYDNRRSQQRWNARDTECSS